MVTRLGLTNWATPAMLASKWKGKDKKGVRVQYLYQLIKKELAQPGSTPIDVLVLDIDLHDGEGSDEIHLVKLKE